MLANSPFSPSRLPASSALGPRRLAHPERPRLCLRLLNPSGCRLPADPRPVALRQSANRLRCSRSAPRVNRRNPSGPSTSPGRYRPSPRPAPVFPPRRSFLTLVLPGRRCHTALRPRHFPGPQTIRHRPRLSSDSRSQPQAYRPRHDPQERPPNPPNGFSRKRNRPDSRRPRRRFRPPRQPRTHLPAISRRQSLCRRLSRFRLFPLPRCCRQSRRQHRPQSSRPHRTPANSPLP